MQLPGGYADLCRVPNERYLVPIGTLDPARAATVACAGITAYGAIRKIPQADAEDYIAVVGCGGVGMTAIALLSATSKAKIIAIDPDAGKREAALRDGAAMAIDPSAADATRNAVKGAGNNIAGVIDFVGSESSTSMAVNLVRRGGTVVIVGLFGGEFRCPVPMFPFKSMTVVGSYVSGLNELRELIALAQTVKLPEIPLTLRPLAEVNASLRDLAEGRVVGRDDRDGVGLAVDHHAVIGEALRAARIAFSWKASCCPRSTRPPKRSHAAARLPSSPASSRRRSSRVRIADSAVSVSLRMRRVCVSGSSR
jgi:D-arabinose 1-dehydrogenase-like Zn-dependent alcohol dehydrogenase